MVDPLHWMALALRAASRGAGRVEPNPMVGCALVRDNRLLGLGYHEFYGGPHAEVNAIASANESLEGATAFVTLEPCCHQGKTPPCTEALISAGIRNVVIAHPDPFPRVDGGGIAQLEEAGIQVTRGAMEQEAGTLLAPYLKLVTQQQPWVIAKWAMTLDGRIASRTHNSQWISGPLSRRVVHELRGRVDAVVVGRGTAEYDDPMLTARPPGVRLATRVVIDAAARLSVSSKLAQSAKETPVLILAHESADPNRVAALEALGVEVARLHYHEDSVDSDGPSRVVAMLDELGRRQMTNVLVEGGGTLMGALHDANAIDECHVFVAPKIAGGAGAISPVEGVGVETIDVSTKLVDRHVELLGDDIYIRGRVAR